MAPLVCVTPLACSGYTNSYPIPDQHLLLDSAGQGSNLGYRGDHYGSESLGSPSLVHVGYITTQDGQAMSMFGENLSTRFQVARTKESMSSD